VRKEIEKEHKMTFNLKNILTIIVLLMCHCSVIWRVTCFKVDKSNAWHIKRAYGKMPYSESEYFTCNIGDLKVTLCPDYLDPNYPVLFGPPCLPIIPAFLFPHPAASNDSIYSFSIITEIVDSLETSDTWTIKPKEIAFFSDSKCNNPLKPQSIHFGKESPNQGFFTGGHLINFVPSIDSNDSSCNAENIHGADDPIEISSEANFISFVFKLSAKDLRFLEIANFGIYKNGQEINLPKIGLLRNSRLVFHWVTVGE
jgi:hypothetical protein